MKILMMTNTYTPHIGGVARSVETFTQEYRARGHDVLVVAPTYENMPDKEEGTFRVPAIQNFNGSDFSVALPFPADLQRAIQKFAPDIVHSHHPFLIGSTAVRIAHLYEIPLVFTHHTRYEEYTHYAPGDSPPLKRFIVRLSTSYANLCDQVFAPSESIAKLLRQRGVESPIEVVPTGVNLERFQEGSGAGLRQAVGIPEQAFVVGHIGRLAPEKNLPYLARAVVQFLKNAPNAHFLVVGEGASERDIRKIARNADVSDRVHLLGALDHPLLASAYQAINVFAFASQTETQGMVLTEAMAVGTPVVAISGPGVDEIVDDGSNGRLLASNASAQSFADALDGLSRRETKEFERMCDAARETARSYAIDNCVDRALGIYDKLVGKEPVKKPNAYNLWTAAQRFIEAEWDVFRNVADAAGAALKSNQGRTRLSKRKKSG
ncbi:MAG: glycosyltransferase [Rhodovibrionaceae bacterium]|nr:glycosyltransferase [Rhodovibrionaceae bacterium]